VNKKRYWNIALVASVAIVAIIAITLIAGVQYATVRSGSMAPAINVGDVVLITPTDVSTIQVNDVVAFHPPGSSILVCHRVVAINADAGYLQTKGDANEDPDWFVVPFQNVVGKVSLDIPYLGYAVSYQTSVYGIGITIMWAAIIIFCSELIKKDDNEDKEGEAGGAA
jgi:signal peptidase I